jgi:N-ethylmaleimide reductase
MVNNGYTKEMAQEAIASGHADLVSFGRLMITNPDLPRRFQQNAPLNVPYQDAPLYGGAGPHGYTDYPSLAA